jgi:cyclic pyranopterin phosphate synthase
MVDAGSKPVSRRRAGAGVVRMAPETSARLAELPKGDALAAASAGIMAAKRTSELIAMPPLPLTHLAVEPRSARAVEIEASAETTAQTGVEMEARSPRRSPP